MHACDVCPAEPQEADPALHWIEELHDMQLDSYWAALVLGFIYFPCPQPLQASRPDASEYLPARHVSQSDKPARIPPYTPNLPLVQFAVQFDVLPALPPLPCFPAAQGVQPEMFPALLENDPERQGRHAPEPVSVHPPLNVRE